MNDYNFFIPVVNRFDLLDRAVESAKDLWPELTIIDNSPGGLDHKYPSPITVFRPCVPLSCSQSFNFMAKETKAMGRNILIWMHSDARAHDGSCQKLLDFARECEAQGRKWGILWTAYDALSAINVNAVHKVGLWDTTLPQYFCENCIQYRLKIAGYELIDTNISVDHEPSQTIKSDSDLAFKNSVTFPLYHFYYQQKYGGDPGKETYRTPFNR